MVKTGESVESTKTSHKNPRVMDEKIRGDEKSRNSLKKTDKDFVDLIYERGVGIRWCENLKMKVSGQLKVGKNRPITFRNSPPQKFARVFVGDTL